MLGIMCISNFDNRNTKRVHCEPQNQILISSSLTALGVNTPLSVISAEIRCGGVKSTTSCLTALAFSPLSPLRELLSADFLSSGTRFSSTEDLGLPPLSFTG